ncbi:MAG: hypothetical protein M3R24_32715 [Chloroflexota bacterium]|nr:hypothetical protein [Chloroflexota bacterium]
MTTAPRMSLSVAALLQQQLAETNRRLASSTINDARRARLLRRQRDLQQLLKGAR